jgi:hypothetical protein
VLGGLPTRYVYWTTLATQGGSKDSVQDYGGLWYGPNFFIHVSFLIHCTVMCTQLSPKNVYNGSNRGD